MNPNPRQFTWALIALLVVGLVVTLVTATLVGTDNTNTIRENQRDTKASLALIRSCTSPGGECYKRGQQQTGAAVATINRVVILAAACSVGLPRGLSVDERQTRIQSCVIERLSQTP